MRVNLKDWCKNEFEVINQLRIQHRLQLPPRSNIYYFANNYSLITDHFRGATKMIEVGA